MGIYVYKLLTRAKQVLINDDEGKQPVYPFVFAYKERSDKLPAWLTAGLNAIEAAWDRRAPARYVTWGDEDAPMMGRELFERADSVTAEGASAIVGENHVSTLTFVGTIEKAGRNLFVRHWHHLDVKTDDANGTHRTLDALGLTNLKRSAAPRRDPHNLEEPNVRFSFYNENDAIVAKVALA